MRIRLIIFSGFLLVFNFLHAQDTLLFDKDGRLIKGFMPYIEKDRELIFVFEEKNTTVSADTNIKIIDSFIGSDKSAGGSIDFILGKNETITSEDIYKSIVQDEKNLQEIKIEEVVIRNKDETLSHSLKPGSYLNNDSSRFISFSRLGVSLLDKENSDAKWVLSSNEIKVSVKFTRRKGPDEKNDIFKFLKSNGLSLNQIFIIRNSSDLDISRKILMDIPSDSSYLKINDTLITAKKEKVDSTVSKRTYRYTVAGDEKEINFSLYRNNVKDSWILYLLNEARKYDLVKDYSAISNVIDPYTVSISSTINNNDQGLEKKKLGCEKDPEIDTTKILADNICYINGAQSIIKQNLPWMVLWLWHTENRFKLDPLGLSSPDNKIEQVRYEIARRESSIQALEALLSQGGCCNPAIMQEYKDDLTSETEDLEKNKSRLAELKTRKEEVDKAVSKHRKTWTIVYNGRIPVTGASKIAWMRVHDASDDFDYVNEDEHPSRYFEGDKVHILIANVPSGQKLSLEENLVDYVSQTAVSEALAPIYVAFEEAAKDVPERKKGLVDKAEPVSVATMITYNQFKNLHSWYLNQNSPASYLNLKAAATADTMFLTRIAGPSKPKVGSKLVTYNLYVTGKDSEKTYKVEGLQYRVYKTQSIQPFAGLIYTLADRTSPVYDPATQTFSQEDLGRFDFIFGVKVFPWKINIEYRNKDYKKYSELSRNHLRRTGNNWHLNRLAVLIGVGTVQNPVSNWFGGISYDVVPGIAATFGGNFYSRNFYNLSNGAVVSETARISTLLYLGFTVDPIVLVKSFQIFSPKIPN